MAGGTTHWLKQHRVRKFNIAGYVIFEAASLSPLHPLGWRGLFQRVTLISSMLSVRGPQFDLLKLV